jgi:ferric-dicitrate binding protein FerR (iron transport regulator)
MKLKREDEEKLRSYVSGTSSPGMDDEVGEMFGRGESNRALRQMMEEDWNTMMVSEVTEPPVLETLLDRIHHRIRLDDYRRSRNILRRVSDIYLKAAAIFLIPVMLAGGYLLYRGTDIKNHGSALSSIYAPRGSRVSFTLPDGTTGMLNSGSTLKYSLPFSDRRDVTLAGEAWFEVKADEKHPFTVDAGDVNLRVVGTSFNVSAYPDEDYVEVVLEKGRILLGCAAFEGEIAMNPSERFLLENGSVTRVQADPSKYSAWTNGKLVFRSDSMSEVARRIERWYNVRVELMDQDLEKYSFRATFEDDPLEEVLRFLAMTSPIRYEIIPGAMGSDSTYVKSRVRIYLK